MEMVSGAEEYSFLEVARKPLTKLYRLTETKMRASDKTVSLTSSFCMGLTSIPAKYLNKLRRHNDIRFEVKKVERTADKVFLLIQVRQL